MTNDWTIEGKVVFTIYDYLGEILVEPLSNFDGEDATPAISGLFFMNETHQKLDTGTIDLFQHIVIRFLYVAKRARLVLQIAVVLLYKRVNCPHTGDWKKQGRLVYYDMSYV